MEYQSITRKRKVCSQNRQAQFYRCNYHLFSLKTIFFCGVFFLCFLFLNQKIVTVELLWKRLWERLQVEIDLQLIYKVSTLFQKSRIFFFLKLILTFLSFHMKKMWVPTVIYSVKTEFKTVQKQIQQKSPKHKSENVR